MVDTQKKIYLLIKNIKSPISDMLVRYKFHKFNVEYVDNLSQWLTENPC